MGKSGTVEILEIKTCIKINYDSDGYVREETKENKKGIFRIRIK